MTPLEGAVLPKGSWILVTGANGFVASHVIDQLLRLGYNVRGTVRDANKHSWLTSYFADKYPDAKFELVELKDLTDVDALERAATGCAGFAAVASDVTFGLDVDQVIKPAIDLAKAALEAAARVPTIKRFVQTSSSTAAVKHEVPAGTPHDVPVDHYNTYAIEKAYRTDGAAAQDPQQALWVYSASKALQEQAVWQWRDEHQKQEGGLPFAVSTVLPDFVLGAILSPANQGYPTSAGYAKAAWDGDLPVAASLPPQYEVDTGDIALLHVAALLHPGIGDGERIFGFAFRKNLTTLLRSMRALYPDRAFLDAPAGEKEYLAEIQGRARAEELLTWAKGSGWTGADESVKAFCDSLL